MCISPGLSTCHRACELPKASFASNGWDMMAMLQARILLRMIVVADVQLQEPKSLEDLTGLTQLHAETHARGMRLQEEGSSSAPHDVSADAPDNASIPDIDDDWTSL